MTKISFAAQTACLAGLAALSVTSSASAQCVTHDFENFSVGSVVSSLSSGAEISAEPSSCPGGVEVVVFQPADGASSGTRAVTVEPGCPDFSPERLVIRFSEAQRCVTFTVGTSVGSGVTVRAFSSYNGGGVIQFEDVMSSRTVNGLIRIGNPEGIANIRRIEIEADFSDFEYLDDLSYGYDITPPEIAITSPAFNSCYCEGDFIPVRGTACESDGNYAGDRLEYRPVNAAADDPWIELGSAGSPLCGVGTLYNIPAASLPNGSVYLRVTGENACGLTSTDVTVVRVDRSAPGVSIDRPIDGSVVCDLTEVCGIVTDGCSVSWQMTMTPLAGGPATLIADRTGAACGYLESIDPAALGLAPGDYELEIVATDGCGQMTSRSIVVEVADDCPSSADINGDGVIDFSDLLAVLAAWSF